MINLPRVLIMLAWLLLVPVRADPLTPAEVPEPLKPWTDWVLWDEQNYRCPFLHNNFDEKRCTWPSRLALSLENGSGTFSIDWKVYAESWVELPGDLKSWPMDVSANRAPALVMERDAKPFLKLQPGYYNITGRFSWHKLPDNLAIPQQSGLIALSVNGKDIDNPLVQGGQIWLKGSDLKQDAEDQLDLQVFRRIDDDVPLKILTRLELQVSGKYREVKLGPPILAGFIPMRLTSPLPARIEPDGNLLVQLRPGRWRIDLLSRHVGPVEQLEAENPKGIWPKEEIWVFAAHPELRLVEIANIRPIDAQLTSLPGEWKKLPAYRLEKGDRMHFKVIRRGDPDPDPDRLSIERIFWLDFDGRGYSVNDKIRGTITHSWRLNALPRTQLGKVELDGRNQLVTRLPGSELRGVEVRNGEINLSADSRIDAPIERIHALGWQQTFHPARATLNLPPGWRLLAAEGLDNVPESWISRWTLLDLFLVLIASLAVARLWNYYRAAFALVTFVLIWHEPGAPQVIWLNILAALALLNVLKPGRLHRLVKFYLNASWIALLVILVPFAITQVRIGLYPQLEKPWQPINENGHVALSGAASLASPASTPMRQPKMSSRTLSESAGASLEAEEQIGSVSPLSDKPSKLDRIDPNANIQTGPGLPQWQWTAISLSWNGPVDSGQEIRLWYVTPNATRLLDFVHALLTICLALLLAGIPIPKFRSNGHLLWVLIVPLLAIPKGPAEAAFPDPELLEELKSRLLHTPDCVPACAQIAKMDLAIDDLSMTIELNVDIRESVGFPLPGQVQQWIAQRVSVDGEDAEALFRDQKGVLWLNLDPGRHQLRLQGMNPALDQFALPMPLNPHRIDVKADGWRIEGMQDNRSPAGQLQFTRKSRDPMREGRLDASDVLPPFVRVERTLKFGLDWHAETRVIRLSPAGSAVILEIPLLPGESVTTPDTRVRNASVLVNMPSDRDFVRWDSILAHSPAIQLSAAETGQWVEIWRADISPIWHMQSEGLAVVHRQDQRGRWLPEWRPWPGETVTLSLTRPEAVSGQILTIDNSRLRINPGKRIREATLNLTLRSSQGAQHTIILPEQAVLQSVSIDQRIQPIRQQDRNVMLPLRPGSQDVAINWREAIPIATLLTTPELNLGIASVNTALHVELPRDRWTLFTFGPAFGPAVLFWGILLVIAAISYALGKIRLAPLKNWQWFLLLLGLSQIPVQAALVVVAWLLALGYRCAHPSQDNRMFNLAQIGLALLTLLSLGLLFFAINQGLLGSPEMQISGNQSSAFRLNWYQDRSNARLPQARVVSVSLTAFRVLMLAWSLWLAISMLNWLKWGWSCFSRGGLWRRSEQKETTVPGDSVIDKKTE